MKNRLVVGVLARWTSAVLAVVPDTPVIEGPITGPLPMHPGIRQGPEGTNFDDIKEFTHGE